MAEIINVSKPFMKTEEVSFVLYLTAKDLFLKELSYQLLCENANGDEANC